MKGKFKTGYKILYMIAAVFVAGICFAVNLKPKAIVSQVLAYTDSTGEKVSAKLDEDILLSVEKVYLQKGVDTIGENEIKTITDSGVQKFYRRTTEKESNDTVNYPFFDIADDKGNRKTVVEDNGFVKLEDKVMSANGGAVQLEQAIMISFGQYILDDNGIIKKSDADNVAKIRRGLSVNIKRNGQPYSTSLESTDPDEQFFKPVARDVLGPDNAWYTDFLYIIPYNEANAGYYEITINYLSTNEHTAKFGFYVVYENSYIGNVEVGGKSYSAYPTIGWEESGTEFSKLPEAGDEHVRYYVGKNGINGNNVSYPTITYDYTKYNFKYYFATTKTTYVFSYPKGLDNAKYLNCTITDNNGVKETVKYDLYNYNDSRSKNIVNIVLTEQGVYEFEFKSVFVDYKNVEHELPFEVGSENLAKKLSIHGFELDYKKYGYDKAQLRYLVMADNSTIDLIVMDGHQERDDLSKYQSEDLGFLYEVQESNEYVGTVLSSSQDALINKDLTSYLGLTENLPSGILDSNSVLDGNNLKDSFVKTALESIKDKYVKTNFSAPWFTNIDTYIGNNDNKVDKLIDVDKDGDLDLGESFYFYSTKPITNADLFESSTNASGNVTYNGTKTTAKEYNHQTIFNKQGYYLVFMNVNPAGISDKEYYQVYAFQYTTETIDIVVTVDDGDSNEANNVTLGAYGYTNKNVIVSWEEPGKFERAISAYYHLVKGYDYYEGGLNLLEEEIDQLILATHANKIGENYYSLGSQISSDEYGRFIIDIRSEGDKSTCKTFTIDKQDIQDVKAYAVKKTSKNVYLYDTNSDGSYKEITNGITDSMAIINWNERWNGRKPSGAYITTTYTSTDIIVDNNITPTRLGNNISTTYKLGSTSGGSYSMHRTALGEEINKIYVMDYQGINIYTLTDSANNSCKYMLIVDKTNAYLEVTDSKNNIKYFSNASVMYSDDVTYNAGQNKAILLPEISTSTSDLAQIIKAAESGNNTQFNDINGVKYYTKNTTSREALKNLFDIYNGEYYLTVKNYAVYKYADETCQNPNEKNVFGSVKYNEKTDKDGTSLIRTLYVWGENNQISSTTEMRDDVNSRIRIEINTDNARGMAYFSDNELSANMIPTVSVGENVDDSKSTVKRLNTGDNENNAEATSSNHVGFVWNVGSSDYEVVKVTYSYYTLNINDGTYNLEDENITIYQKGSTDLTTLFEKNTRRFYKFGGSGNTPDGLYVVTREYAGGNIDQKDSQVLSYYFIVDRNKIITEHMLINMLNGETSYNNFTSPMSGKTFDFTYKGKEITTYSYLQTTKIPATLQVPVAKYFNGSTGSGQQKAGRLKIELFFIDSYNQYEGDTYTLYESFDVYGNNYHSIDIYKFLNAEIYQGNGNKGNKFLLGLMNQLKTGDGYLYLPGEYVLVVTDYVRNSSNTNNQIFLGFEITKNTNPTTDVKISYEDNDESMILAEVYENYTIETNNEFVRVEIPDYDINSHFAQIDRTNISVVQYIDNTKTKEYKESLSDGKKYFSLDTMMRKDGMIDPETINRELYYLVTIRYKAIDPVNNNFSGMYYYIEDGKEVNYYSTTYKIVIDRKAPGDNIGNLQDNDESFIDLSSNYQNNSRFVDSYREVSTREYFIKQYLEYYAQKENNKNDRSLIYAFNTNNETDFNSRDVAKLKIKAVADITQINLNLPVLESEYTDIDLNGIENYSQIIASYGSKVPANSDKKFFEVLEYDRAGNIAQYVIYYNTTSSMLNISIEYQKVTDSASDLTQNVIGKIENNTTLNVFGIDQIDSSNNNGYDYFYYVGLYNAGNLINYYDTNLTSNFDFGEGSVGYELIKDIKTLKEGSFELKIYSRTNVKNPYTLIINLYDSENIEELSIDALIETINDVKYVNLTKAVKTVGKVKYYATEVKIQEFSALDNKTTTYKCFPELGYVYYRLDNQGNRFGDAVERVACNTQNATYRVTMTDIFENVKVTTFNTSGELLFNIEFENVFGSDLSYYQDSEDTYYGFTKTTLTYNTNLYDYEINSLKLSVNDTNTYEDFDDIEKISIVNGNKIVITPSYEYGGDYIELKISFGYKDETNTFITDKTYRVIIDTRVNMPSLTGSKGDESSNIVAGDNKNASEFSPTLKPMSGVKTLSWIKNENEYFDYKYILHEKMKEQGFVSTDLTNKNIVDISTNDDESTGRYVFEIAIYSKDGHKLGNKLCAFEVHSIANQLYYITDSDGNVYETAQAQYKFNESIKLSSADKWDVKPTNFPTKNIPLFIANRDLTVVFREDIATENIHTYTLTTQLYVFEFYSFKTSNNVELYFGILKIPETNNLVSSLRINDKNMLLGGTSYVFADKSDTVSITGTRVANTINDTYGLIEKNQLVLNVMNDSADNEMIDSRNYSIVGNNSFEYELLGNWQYKFSVMDLAGNVHTFADGATISRANIAREVVVKVEVGGVKNAPIDNAYYNEPVTIEIVNAEKYVTGSLKVKATRNGVEVEQSEYTYTDFGTYRIEITGTYFDETYEDEQGNVGKEYTLTKVLVFNIINPEESRKSLDLSSLSSYSIDKITGYDNVDYTNKFKEIFAEYGMKISYDILLEYADELNISSGKQVFNLTYSLQDSIYPKREHSFAFTLNNEMPTLNYELHDNDTWFIVYYNPGIIYSQVGEAIITINGKPVVEIVEGDPAKVLPLTRSHDDGVGDYYVTLETKSGTVITSFKVTLREPLNIWAIIIIVVVAVVVITVTVVIIVLRNKMRIR